ncbi:hypothetical protein CEXT_774811 [Caerostris extrusa]|uniref:Secreted protein n=1 Tax=Caerostris extrusa TaxID=172846 RepID=A0AAV4VN49_CAEEX|nr:hypothetical protein CEXT_774811 [Caerostris extrusa]
MRAKHCSATIELCRFWLGIPRRPLASSCCAAGLCGGTEEHVRLNHNCTTIPTSLHLCSPHPPHLPDCHAGLQLPMLTCKMRLAWPGRGLGVSCFAVRHADNNP